ncbi:hypothetical protein BpHYR1_029056 [Brachionus plicatilis]|uniref:Uncharacterized protein n=1 Tax=Brachionus plicatilis TaxID=10195 RepID=A0A3M7PZU1_BRAPC|nr:hypothetical protein BpHYR1_029056 [Brachionus plicatilis]
MKSLKNRGATSYVSSLLGSLSSELVVFVESVSGYFIFQFKVTLREFEMDLKPLFDRLIILSRTFKTFYLILSHLKFYLSNKMVNSNNKQR